MGTQRKSVIQSAFQMTVEKPIPKLLLRPITTGEDSAMDQSEFLAITRTYSKRGKNRAYKVQLVLVLVFFDWKPCPRLLSQSQGVAIAIISSRLA